MALGDSVVGICNLALVELGEDPIAALADNTKRAILCGLRYDPARRAALRAHPWNFARAQAQLAASASAPMFTYGYAYPLPVDCLRVLDLPDNDDAEWDIIGGALLTDEAPPLAVLYLSDQRDTTRFDALFVRVLALRLALELAEPLAQLITSQENSAREWDEDIWLRAHR